MSEQKYSHRRQTVTLGFKLFVIDIFFLTDYSTRKMHKNAAFYYLHRAVRDLLHLKCVDDPHSEIADEEESDHLPAGLVGVLAAV